MTDMIEQITAASSAAALVEREKRVFDGILRAIDKLQQRAMPTVDIETDDEYLLSWGNHGTFRGADLEDETVAFSVCVYEEPKSPIAWADLGSAVLRRLGDQSKIKKFHVPRSVVEAVFAEYEIDVRVKLEYPSHPSMLLFDSFMESSEDEVEQRARAWAQSLLHSNDRAGALAKRVDEWNKSRAKSAPMIRQVIKRVALLLALPEVAAYDQALARYKWDTDRYGNSYTGSKALRDWVAQEVETTLKPRLAQAEEAAREARRQQWLKLGEEFGENVA